MIDCTKSYPDAEITFDIDPLAVDKDKVIINRAPHSTVHDDTLNLLRAVYSTHGDYPKVTKRKKLEATNIINELLKELNDFKELIEGYLENRDQQDYLDLEFELNNKSKFTAFKRWMVRNDNELNSLLSPLFMH